MRPKFPTFTNLCSNPSLDQSQFFSNIFNDWSNTALKVECVNASKLRRESVFMRVREYDGAIEEGKR